MLRSFVNLDPSTNMLLTWNLPILEDPSLTIGQEEVNPLIALKDIGLVAPL